ncbi:hypothetical protein ATANTOWER_030654, partial [Ataeniobius toweri]|nr:hypothetical protein [Ataeniobius toweri]
EIFRPFLTISSINNLLFYFLLLSVLCMWVRAIFEHDKALHKVLNPSISVES